jgi:hypothetical protein
MTVEEWTQLVDLLDKAWDAADHIYFPAEYTVESQADIFFAARCEAEKNMESV